MRRRDFIKAVAGSAMTWPLVVRAQQSDRMRRIGVLMGYAETDPSAQAQVEALRQELQKLGWEEGRNILIDVNFPAADAGRVRAALTELMSLTPDLLVTNTNLVTAVVQQKSAPYRLFSSVWAIRSVPVLSVTRRAPLATSRG
jgi:putative ABC transport system substrate-binding protein